MNKPDLPYAFIEKYIEFCSSPFLTREQKWRDAERLAQVNHVAGMAFGKLPGTLIIGTHPIIITNPTTGIRHHVGSFLITIVRRKLDWEWDARFVLQNLDGCLTVDDCTGSTTYMHPHMVTETDKYLGQTVAKICISVGRFHIFQHIRRGELAEAVTLIIQLLHSMGPNAAYYKISNWPIAKETQP